MTLGVTVIAGALPSLLPIDCVYIQHSTALCQGEGS